jgi:hypothetical protein
MLARREFMKLVGIGVAGLSLPASARAMMLLGKPANRLKPDSAIKSTHAQVRVVSQDKLLAGTGLTLPSPGNALSDQDADTLHLIADKWAAAQPGFAAGFPTFVYYGAPTIKPPTAHPDVTPKLNPNLANTAIAGWEVVLIREGSISRQTVLRKILSSPAFGGSIPAGESHAWLHRAAHRWAAKEGFVGGFPTCLRQPAGHDFRYEIIGLKPDQAEIHQVNQTELEDQLGNTEGGSWIGKVVATHIAVSLWAENVKQRAGFPNFETAPVNGHQVWGVISIK